MLTIPREVSEAESRAYWSLIETGCFGDEEWVVSRWLRWWMFHDYRLGLAAPPWGRAERPRRAAFPHTYHSRFVAQLAIRLARRWERLPWPGVHRVRGPEIRARARSLAELAVHVVAAREGGLCHQTMRAAQSEAMSWTEWVWKEIDAGGVRCYYVYGALVVPRWPQVDVCEELWREADYSEFIGKRFQ